jgi:hypothetical protein
MDAFSNNIRMQMIVSLGIAAFPKTNVHGSGIEERDSF